MISCVLGARYHSLPRGTPAHECRRRASCCPAGRRCPCPARTLALRCWHLWGGGNKTTKKTTFLWGNGQPRGTHPTGELPTSILTTPRVKQRTPVGYRDRLRHALTPTPRRAPPSPSPHHPPLPFSPRPLPERGARGAHVTRRRRHGAGGRLEAAAPAAPASRRSRPPGPGPWRPVPTGGDGEGGGEAAATGKPWLGSLPRCLPFRHGPPPASASGGWLCGWRRGGGEESGAGGRLLREFGGGGDGQRQTDITYCVHVLLLKEMYLIFTESWNERKCAPSTVPPQAALPSQGAYFPSVGVHQKHAAPLLPHPKISDCNKLIHGLNRWCVSLWGQLNPGSTQQKLA